MTRSILMLLLFISLTASAKGFSQTSVTIHLKGVNAKQAIAAIEKKTSLRFVYEQSLVKDIRNIHLEAENESVTNLLNRLFSNYGIHYTILENNLVVLKSAELAAVADTTVTGTVTNPDGTPAIGVTVTIKGTNIATSTDENGRYTITVPEGSILVFSSVGMQTFETPVAGRAVIDVQMTEDVTDLGEVVVIGYGSANKRDLTGSIVTIKGDEIANRPAANPLNLLQGKVTGLSVVNSGAPGAEPDIRVRGTNSINGVRPVYIVDGILNDNINFLNPSDIESIEVLKDPSSLAIFGVRGANGAIVVTTKKAKAGQLLVNFNTTFGMKRVQDRMDLTDGPQFKELYDEQLANQGNPPFNYDFWTANTDWQDVIFQNGMLNYNNISITGASEKNRFYLGLGYINEEGIILYEEYKKYTLNFNDELKVNNNLRFGITLNTYYADLPRLGSVGSAIRAAPIAPVRDPATGLLHTLPSFQRAQVFNPLVSIENERFTSIRKEYRAVGSIYGEVDFLRNFTFRAQLYADYGFNTSRGYSPILYVYNPEITGPSKNDTSRYATSVNQSQNIYPKTQMDYLLTFKKDFGDHNLTVLGGFTTYYSGFESTSSSIQQGSSMIIPNNPNYWYVDQVGDPATRQGSGSAWEDASMSYLARALYSFQNKYLINASFRRDGSSQFYRLGNHWKNFGAVGLGWVVSQENFFADVEKIDYLKLKGSWGVLGNKNIGDAYRYPAYPTLTSANSGVFGENVVAALQREYIPSPDLNWETVHSWEAGFELRAFRNRLFFEANYYHKLTKDVLTLIPGPSGTAPGLANLGEIQNKGFEFAASWDQELGNDMILTISGNLTTIDNKVNKLNLEGFEIVNGASRTTAGYPIGYFYGYVHDGIYQTATHILRSPASMIGTVLPGDIKYKDINGDGLITPEDRTVIGNPTPDFIYGGSINLKYKGFDLGIDLQGVYGNEIYRAWDQGTFADVNYLSDRMNRWRGVGTSNWEPILNSKRANNYQNSSYRIEDGSFFRIRNVQLGYNFSPSVLESMKVKSLRLFVNAQNLATFFNSTGYTPEIGGSTTSFGVDNGTYPVPAIYTVGLNLNF